MKGAVLTCAGVLLIGFAFVEYSTVSEAQRAIEELCEFDQNGVGLRVMAK